MTGSKVKGLRLAPFAAWLCGVVLVGIASAADLNAATDWFRKGNAAYEQGKYEAAAEDYQKAVDLGVANSRLYFNYGNALFRLNRLGPAILFFERARKLAPADDDINFNLRFALSRVVDKVPEPESNFLTKVLWALHVSYSLPAGVWAGLILFSVIFLGATAGLFLPTWLRWLPLTVAGISLLALLGLTPSLVYKIHQHETEQYGIVLEPTVEMFSGPGDSYQVLTKVHEGTRFEIVERHGDWMSVKLANGKGGYVRANQLGKV